MEFKDISKWQKSTTTESPSVMNNQSLVENGGAKADTATTLKPQVAKQGV
jgi:hypothetical protein